MLPLSLSLSLQLPCVLETCTRAWSRLDERIDAIVEDAALPADPDLLGPTVAAVSVAGPEVGAR